MTRPIEVLLYGDVNLNVLDGSAVWLTSVAEMLTRHPRVHLTVLLKAPEERQLLSGRLHGLPRTRVVPPSGTGPMLPDAALDVIEALDRERRCDALILRGLALSTAAAARSGLRGRLWPYLTDVPQDADAVTGAIRRQLTEIARASDLLLCQTPELRDHLEGVLEPAERRSVVLPPMVPELFNRSAPRTIGSPATRFFYAGKFAPRWGVEELVRAVVASAADRPGVVLHLAGDKFHRPADDPEFPARVRAALESPGGSVVWHGGLPRERVAELLEDVDVAFSVRDREMNASLELSTKVLEYGAAGVPVVLNRTPMHERLLGADYPLFVEDTAGLAEAVDLVRSDVDALRVAQQRVEVAAAAHSIEQVAARFAPFLERLAPLLPTVSRRHRLLIAGHDLKFLRPYLPWFERSGIEVRTDHWSGHAAHDEATSAELLGWADTVLAEWCLGNARWYAEHRSGQRLVTRLHRMELETTYPSEIDRDALDDVIVVSEHIAREVDETFGWRADGLTVVPNSVDVLRLERAKLPHADRTLGILGVLPRLKRLDRALDLLESLTRDDPRWRLRVGGLLPFELPWVWARDAERSWYAEQLERIRRHPRLRRSVSLEGRVFDVASWLQQVGVILSPSEVESFHLAAAEGMASGAVPVFWPRPGADEIFPGPWHHAGNPEAVDALRGGAVHSTALEASELVRRRYAIDQVAPQLLATVLG